jgi:uncharacterized membrane protein
VSSAGRESLETKIGRYWLNRIGITALVLSVAFFILYNFPRLGPHMKIATGCAVSVLLLLGGMRIERDHALRWYGRGLIGGAWALLYFTAYAMYHVPVTRILDSAVVDLALLFVIAAGAVTHAMRYRSQVITALATLLGFLTITISTVSSFTLVATALLVAGLVFIIIRMRWYGFCLYAVLLSYLTYLAQTNNSYGVAMSYLFGVGLEQETDFWLNAGFLITFWVGFTVALLGLDEETLKRRRTLVAATLANALLFVNLLMVHMSAVYPDQRSVVLLGIGIVYAVLTPIARRRNLPTISTVHLVLALALPTLAIAVGLSDRWTVFLWALEVPILIWVGLRLGRLSYRVFAFSLACINFVWIYALEIPSDALVGIPGGVVIAWRLLIAAFATGAFGVAAAIYWSKRYRPQFVRPEAFAFYAYFFMANAFVWELGVLEPPAYLRGLGFAVAGSLVLLLGWQLADRWVRGLGALWSMSALFAVVALAATEPPGLHVIPIYGVAALAFAAGFLHRRQIPGTAFPQESLLEYYYAVVGAIILVVALAEQLPREWVWFAWAAEGLALLVLGFGMKDRIYRVIALSVFALAAFTSILMLTARGQEFLVGPNYGVAALAFVASFLYRRKIQGTAFPNEAVLEYFYSLAGAVILVGVLARHVPGAWIWFAWAVEGFIFVGLGFALRDRVHRLTGFAISTLAAFGASAVLTFGAGTLELIPHYGVVVLVFLASLLYRRGIQGEIVEIEWALKHYYAAAGAVILTLLLWRQIPEEWLSLAWAAEGFALVAMGFALTERIYRILGLSVFGILVLKILFVDLAGAETMYRILSFLAVGVLMLLASYAYGRFSGQDGK